MIKTNDLVFTFCTITEESILERGKIESRRVIENRLKDFNETYTNIESDPIDFLDDENIVIPLYVNGNLSMKDIKRYDEFMYHVNEFDTYVRETLVSYYEDNRNKIHEYFTENYNRGYSNILNNIDYDTDNISNISSIAYIMIENNYMGIGISAKWTKNFIEIPIIENGEWVSLDGDTHNSLSIIEVTTFRDLKMVPDMGIIITHGTARSFLGKNSVSFPIWLLNTYEINELQEERFQDFQKRHSYYSKLVTDSLIKYFKINYSNILRDSKMKIPSAINRRYIMDNCSISKLEISSNGSVYIVLDTSWNEEISIQLWDKDVQLTNYFALPIVGSKYGKIN